MRYSAAFERAIRDELLRVDRMLDTLDERIERASTQATRDALSARRAQWVAYERQLRRLLHE